ncbi:sensor histidine kinase [Streptomyces sp. NPDC020917]|uniref:sensor histidine kinase n=1 Tax=Streptomyces sp. NPDC020917 TaxID=3365102 RepID=UPI003795906E
MTRKPLSLRWRQFSRRRPRLADVTVITAVFVCTAGGSGFTNTHTSVGTAWAQGLALSVAGCLTLLMRRRHPAATVVVTALFAVAATFLGFLLTPLTLGPLMLALYWMAVDHDRRTSFRWAVSTAAVLVAATLVASPRSEPLVLKTINPIAWLLLMPVLGGAVQLRRAYVDAMEARAVFAERTREEEARHRVAEERIRIARDLHDVVAHHLALANAQAGTAAYLARTHPDPRVGSILDELAGTTASALRELKATVGVLRDASDDDSPLLPAPGLADLPALARSFASTGLTVELSTTGTSPPVSAGVALTAYRIVQEALTNVAKHTDTDTAYVDVAYATDHLTVSVTNNGPTSKKARARRSVGQEPSGFGLLGMAERAQMVGGHVAAGHSPDGGFTVTADLPLLPGDLPPSTETPEPQA